ncbi:MAG: hypothetical protein MK132_13685 [Lentisphaerales bacterium]|nr:hypothetical protein [Lentisphaerales bacterium]
MKFLTHIAIILSISLAAVLPNSMVLCEKDGSISIEFKQGDSCSCSGIIADLIEKFCCEKVECHEDEQITNLCHDELQMTGSDCQDTKFDIADFVKAPDHSTKAPVKTLAKSSYFSGDFAATIIIDGLFKPVDVGKSHYIPENLSTSPLLTHRTSVLII